MLNSICPVVIRNVLYLNWMLYILYFLGTLCARIYTRAMETFISLQTLVETYIENNNLLYLEEMRLSTLK